MVYLTTMYIHCSWTTHCKAIVVLVVCIQPASDPVEPFETLQLPQLAGEEEKEPQHTCSERAVSVFAVNKDRLGNGHVSWVKDLCQQCTYVLP